MQPNEPAPATRGGHALFMAFQTTPQPVNAVVRQLCERYSIAPGFVRHGLRELGYTLPTTCGRAKYNRAQMSTLWGDFATWMEGQRKCAR